MKKRPDKTGLIDQDSANIVIASLAQPKAKAGRPIDDLKSNRVRFNTMLDKAIKRQVKVYAANNDLSIADVIDAALKEYLHRK